MWHPRISAIRPLWALALAPIGATLLLVVATTAWVAPGDEMAYWLAARRLMDGLPLYDPAATAITPYAYWYPPIMAQALVPVAALLPAEAFGAVWILLLLSCLWWLAGRSILVALALTAFPPVAVELWMRNVHLVLAVMVVLGLAGRGGWFMAGAAIKFAPGLGIPYMAAQERWRSSIAAVLLGIGLVSASFLISPQAWWQYVEILASRGLADAAALVPVPYVARLVPAAVLAIAAGRIGGVQGALLLILAVVLALPTLWMTGLSVLVAMVPVARGMPLRLGSWPNHSEGHPKRVTIDRVGWP